VFTRLREANPKALTGDKLIAIAGDVSEINLGLSPEDRQLLAENVSVFFHAAATVRFDDSFRKAVSLNTRGTHEALKLAEEMKQIVVRLVL
jgi:fatty acyl-CoA reductase